MTKGHACPNNELWTTEGTDLLGQARKRLWPVPKDGYARESEESEGDKTLFSILKRYVIYDQFWRKKNIDRVVRLAIGG